MAAAGPDTAAEREARAGAPLEASADGLLHLLPDAHAHPQLDVDNLGRVASLRVPCVAAMGVAVNVDWGTMERLAQMAGPSKVIPGFGIHPWWAHLHASEVGSTWEELLEGPSQEEVAKAVALLQVEREKQRAGGAADAAGRYQAGRQRLPDAEGAPGGGSHASNNIQPPAGDGQACGCAAVAAASASGSSSRVRGVAGEAAAREGPSSISGSSSDGSGMGGSTGGERGGGQGPLDIVPHDAWLTRLRSLLVSHPHALVGEVGVDRAAVIPGSRARVRFDHQMALLRQQLAVAAELGRPVSIHCVRGYGHLLQLFAGLPRDGGGCPPAVMLHSYGGSPEDVARFCRLPDIGRRFFFSFSSAINGRAPDKMAARIRAVPDDRLLLESDQVTPLLVDQGMADICRIVAGAKGWTLEQAARRTLDNFNEFYARQAPL